MNDEERAYNLEEFAAAVHINEPRRDDGSEGRCCGSGL